MLAVVLFVLWICVGLIVSVRIFVSANAPLTFLSQMTPQIKIYQTWCQKWRWWRWSGNTKTSSTYSEPAHRMVSAECSNNRINAGLNHCHESHICSLFPMQVLCMSWWNTPPKATWGSTCVHGGHRAWTTPSTRAKSPMSSSRSKTLCPVPTRLPEAWSILLHRRLATLLHFNSVII